MYRSGYVTCKKTAVLRSHGGCEVDSKIATVVTDQQNKVQFPQDYRRSAYILPGYHKNSTELVFSALFSPLFVREGMELDVTNTGNGERGTENRERESGNKCTAAILLRIQNGGQNKRKARRETIWVKVSFHQLCPQMASTLL